MHRQYLFQHTPRAPDRPVLCCSRRGGACFYCIRSGASIHGSPRLRDNMNHHAILAHREASPSSEVFSHCRSLSLVLSRAFYCQSILPRRRLLRRLWTISFFSSSFDIHYSRKDISNTPSVLAGRITLPLPSHHHKHNTTDCRTAIST